MEEADTWKYPRRQMIHLYLRDILTAHSLWVEWYFPIIEITIISEVPDVPEEEVGVWESWLLRYRQGAWENTSECKQYGYTELSKGKEDKVKPNPRRLCRKSLPPYVLIIIIACPHDEWQLMLFPMDSCSASEFWTTRDACSVSIDFYDPSIFLKLYIYDKNNFTVLYLYIHKIMQPIPQYLRKKRFCKRLEFYRFKLYWPHVYNFSAKRKARIYCHKDVYLEIKRSGSWNFAIILWTYLVWLVWI